MTGHWLTAARPHAVRWLLGFLLLAMAAGQLANPAGFVDILATYRLGGTAASVLGAAILIAGELAAGAGLFSRDTRRRRRAASIAVGVAIAWTAAGLQAFIRGLDLGNCGCFGVYAGQALRWWVLVEDLEFVAVAVWVRGRVHRHAMLAEHGVGTTVSPADRPPTRRKA